VAKIRYVEAEILREKYNTSKYVKMIDEGLMQFEMLNDNHLNAPEPFKGPYCTRSQTLRYKNNDGTIAVELHRYLRPDGTFGASGRPEPKRLSVEDELWAIPAKRRV